MKRVLFGLLVVGVVAGYAAAGMSTIGDPWDSGSWSQRFRQSGVGSFDLVGTRMVGGGDYFKSPTHSNFNRSGWEMIAEGPAPITEAAFGGPAATSVDWDLHLDGSKSNALALDCFTFLEGALIEWGTLSWSGSKWAWTGYDIAGCDVTADEFLPGNKAAVVPAPGALLLAGLGTSIVGSLRRRRAI